VYEPYGRPFVPSPSYFLCSEVLNAMGIASQLFPSVLPSNIPSSSPSSFERRVVCLWQRDDLPHNEEICAPSVYPSCLWIEFLSIILGEECFEVTGSSASDLSSQFPRLLPSYIPTKYPSDDRCGSAPMFMPSSNPSFAKPSSKSSSKLCTESSPESSP